jgi:hypothetical protein
MNQRYQERKRPLSPEEAEWIERWCEDIEAANDAISDLAELASILIDMADDMADEESFDPYYRGVLRGKGVSSIAYGIKQLSRMVAEKKGSIVDTIEGTTAAIVAARVEHVRKVFMQCQGGQP